MMNKKYELVKTDTLQTPCGKTLFRVRALIAIGLWQFVGVWKCTGVWQCVVVWFTKVGSENGTLTVCRGENGLVVTRGCFCGSVDEFFEASNKKHDEKTKHEYRLLIEVANSRLAVSG